MTKYFGTENPHAVDPLPFWEIVPPHIGMSRHIELSGWGGSGIVPERAWTLLHALPWIFVWAVVRYVMKSLVFPKITAACGMRGRLRTWKACNQMWLLTYYVSTSILATYMLKDEKWFEFPINKESAIAMFWPAYQLPSEGVQWMYNFQLGFYLCELVFIVREPRRSDFYEYVLHHILTISLVVFSSLALTMRIGAYVFFIHDASDIFLCATKTIHYLWPKSVMVYVTYVAFMVLYFFFRLYCLPTLSYYIFTFAPQIHECSWAYYLLSWVLGFALQGLHIFWTVLIIRMLVQMMTGNADRDVRSDDDAEDEAAAPKAAGASAARVSTARMSTAAVADKKKKK